MNTIVEAMVRILFGGAAPAAEPARPVFTAEAAASMAREAAETLAHRSKLALLVYPVLLLTAACAAPGVDERLRVMAPCGLLMLLVTGIRLAAVLSFDRRYSADPSRWLRNFRAGACSSALIWVAFGLEQMNASGDGWPTWMIVLMTTGLAAGTTSSLSPDPPLLNVFLLLMLGPMALWGLARGGPDGTAIAILVSIYLIFILAQGRHNSQVFRQSAFDKQALREAGRRRDALVNSIDGIVWEADPRRMRFTFVNRHAEIILGYPVEHWLTKPSFWAEHVHPDDLEHAARYAGAETAAGRDYTLEYRMLAADGSVVWLRDIVSVGREGAETVALRGIMVDVTEHKRASEERSMLAQALRTVKEAVSIADPAHRTVFVNDSFLHLYGYTRAEMLSGNIALVRSAKNPAELDAAIATGTNGGGWQGEIWNRRKDGSEFPISLSTSLVRDEFGRIIAKIGVATDITQRKCEEDEMRRAEAAAEAASWAKSEFLANLSHEIRSPVNAIISENRLLLGTPLDQRQRRLAEGVRASARLLLSVLNDILDFSRIDAGEIELQTERGGVPASLPETLPVPARVQARQEFRLLIAEDDPTNREVTLGVLRQLGYAAVEAVSDGRQALEALASADFDLVLMDCQMPEMDGYEASRRIRERSTPARNHQVPIVAMTAGCVDGHRAQCLAAGMDDYVAKPVRPNILQEVLERWLPVRGVPVAAGPGSGLATAIDQVAEGVVISDAAGRIQYVNQAFSRMTGYAREEVIGQNPRVLKSGRHDAAFYKHMWETIQAGEVWRGELTNRRKDGTDYTETMTITPVRNARGAIASFIAVKQDVTARRAGENAQRMLAAIVQSSQDAIFSHTPAGTVASWNRGAEVMFGYAAREIVGTPAAMLLPPEMNYLVRGYMERLRQGDTISQLESMAIGKDGRKIDISLSVSPIHDTAGQLLAAAVIVRDITARKRSEEALREREEQIRSIFEHAPVGIALTAHNGRLLRVNAALCQILGYSEQEFLAARWQQLTPPDDLDRSERVLAQFQQGQITSAEFEKSYIHKNGNVVPVRIKLSAVQGNRSVPCFIAHIEDITQAKQAKEALQASEERYRLLFERNLAGVLRTDMAGRILDCNLAACLIMGAAPEDILGDSAFDYYYNAGDRSQVLHAVRDRKVLTNHELRLRRRDGQPVWVIANFGLVDERERGVMEITLVDITDRKQAEERLREAKEIAERANRAKSVFLANMSHEIRTPMNGILGMAALLLQSDLDARQRQRAETVRSSAEALLDVLNDLLDFSKIEAHKLQLEEAAFDLRKVVEGVADLMAVKAQEKGLELLCFIEPDVPTALLGDSGRLRQILVNLAGNAVKFTAAGEVSIRVKLEAAGQGESIRFEVSDTGIGVPSDKRHLLFQPFSQVDPSTSRQYGGTGLGLSIVRMLAEIMRGRVGCESEEGKGSCFWFIVPLERQSGYERPRPLSLAGRHILVVDHNARSRQLSMELLAFWKARTDQAGTTEEAFHLLRSAADDPFDAVLVDLELSGVNGEQPAVLMRWQSGLARTPIVLLTPLSRSADAEHWRGLGFAGSVSKPVKQGELGGCLASILGCGPAPACTKPRPERSQTDRELRSGMHLLVVEDNKVNQAVALGILETLGYRADVVEDGRSALLALGQKDYDVVLMDCQLPEIDGYEASHLIRQPDTPVRNHDIPIIATTAHAMAGDREKCFAAGMNGYLSKPLEPRALEQAIEEWTGGMPAGIEPAGRAPVHVTAALAAPFDRKDFVERLMGNQELAQRIIRGFVEDMPRQIALLAQAVGTSDAKQARLVAHSIKGSAANVCGEELREIAYRLEQQSSTGDLTAAAAALPELAASFERIRPVMESFCGEDPTR